MKKIISVFLISAFLFLKVNAQPIFLTTAGTVSFFSEAPIENIDATSNQAVGAINTTAKTIYFKVAMKSFVFRNSLMQEHFNENYAESDKYPYATFNGTVSDATDLSKDGNYQVSVAGTFTIHGVNQNQTIKGTINVKGNQVELTSSFDLKPADYSIKIPKVVASNVAEDVQVKLHATLSPPASGNSQK
jgi:polyisoprenoid-binding protein YceI